jgi:hypothetical protein
MGVRIANDRDPRRHSGPGEAHAMPRLCWRVCDVALVGNEHRHQSNSEFHPAFQNEPELRASYVKVTQIIFPCRRLRRRIAPDDVRVAHVDVTAVMSVADKLIWILFGFRMFARMQKARLS